MEAEFEELIHSSRGMLSSNEISELGEFIQARQYALGVEALCGTLVDENKHVTDGPGRGIRIAPHGETHIPAIADLQTIGPKGSIHRAESRTSTFRA
jgi:hypothetical protein